MTRDEHDRMIDSYMYLDAEFNVHAGVYAGGKYWYLAGDCETSDDAAIIILLLMRTWGGDRA